VLAPGGAQQGIYATLTSGGARSLSLISAGLQKLFSVVVALADAKKGIVLIDEIENGIFYEKYASTWATLYNLSKKTDSQLFVSSHSSECLEALLPTLNIDNNADDFCLLRTERENGKCSVRHISGASMKAALKRGGELRGAALDQKTQAHN
jgi:AAA15 family ATPase/GTPase